jgi:beta-galactosidase
MAPTIRYPVSKPDWSNLAVLHKNTLTPRAWFHIYENEKDALSRDVTKSKTLSLNGTWKFKLDKYPIEPAREFFEPGFDASGWGDIEVPGIWQLQGYGHGPQYLNVWYPFPGDPPNIPLDDNETGHYNRTFRVPKKFKDHQLRLRFEGVDSSFHVWVNGKEVGYSQGSRNPSEFDITKLVHEDKENTISVRVYQRCDGSYIEDQVCSHKPSTQLSMYTHWLSYIAVSAMYCRTGRCSSCCGISFYFSVLRMAVFFLQ